MYLFVTADIPLWQLDLMMALLGLGLGQCMQTLVLAVQNAVPARDMGVATSSTTFFRQMGGTLGTAIFLSIVFSTVGDKIADQIRTAVGNGFGGALTDPAVAANPVNQQVLQGLQSGGGRPRLGRADRLVVPAADRLPAGRAVPERLHRVDDPGVPRRRVRHGGGLRAGAVHQGAAAAHHVRRPGRDRRGGRAQACRGRRAGRRDRGRRRCRDGRRCRVDRVDRFGGVERTAAGAGATGRPRPGPVRRRARRRSRRHTVSCTASTGPAWPAPSSR